jgi:hypothetical protein
MNNSTSNVIFIGNHANKIKKDVPVETLNDYSLKSVEYKRGSLFDEENPKLVLNDIACDYNGEYEIENLSIALNFSLEHLAQNNSNTILIGDPFELLFQASIYAWLRENPKNVKLNPATTDFSNLTVVLLYPATMEFENLRKEISHIVYVLKKHKVNTFLIENHINQASALDSILYYFEPESVLQLEHQVKGLKQILGHSTPV